MEKLYVKCFMAVAMLFMTVQNASAYDTKFTADQLDEAKRQLEQAVFEGMALNDELMTKDAQARLSEAVALANAVYDSDRKENVNEINAVMPDLVKNIDEAKESNKQCAEILVKAKDFVASEQEAIFEAAEKAENQSAAIQAALDDLYDQCGKVEAFLGLSEHISDAMVEAFKNGKTIRDILEMAGNKLPTIEETIIAAGISSVENAASDNAVEYNLIGARVQPSYKGLIIKGGKKIIRR